MLWGAGFFLGMVIGAAGVLWLIVRRGPRE